MMETYLAAFQRYLDIERQASPHTLRNYLSDLHQFVHFASARLGQAAPLMPAQIDASLIRDFLSTLYQQGVGLHHAGAEARQPPEFFALSAAAGIRQ